MATLSKITIKNYKSLADIQDFELRPLNILIGPNGSGKSNLLDFFRLLKNAANEELASTIRAEGGFQQILWQGVQEDSQAIVNANMFFNRTFRLIEQDIAYGLSLSKSGQTYVISREEVAQRSYGSDFKQLLFSYNGLIRKLVEEGSNGKHLEDVVSTEYVTTDRELIIAQLRDRIRFYHINEIRQTLYDWHIFRGFGDNALKNIYDSQLLELVSPLRLDPEGRNLVSVLHHLKDPDNSGAYDELIKVMAQAFPDFKSLNFPLSATGRAELNFNLSSWRFAASQVSDGMLRFLGLATLLLMPDPPPLIAIDEPEIGLHPRLLPLLAGLMKSASGRTQLIVATHSPILISADDITLDDIVLVEMEDGKTQLSRPDSERLSRWLQNFTIGNLWTMGRLEAQ